MNLKKLVMTSAVSGLAIVGGNVALAETFDYRGETHAAAICRAVVEDNPAGIKTQLRKATRHDRLRHTSTPSVDSYTCNGLSLADFAAQHDARKTLVYLGEDAVSEAIAKN